MQTGDDPTPWSLLHDGTIVRLERDLADTVIVWIDVPYIRARLDDVTGETLFRFRLAGCTKLEYTPYDEPPIHDLAAIAASEPSLVEAKAEGDGITVWGSAGVLTMRYASLEIELDPGRALPLEELERAVRGYWEAWRAMQVERRP